MGSGWLRDCCMIYKNQVTRHRAIFPAGAIEVTFLSLYFPVESSLERLQASGPRQQRSRFLSPPVSWRAFYQNSRNLYFCKKTPHSSCSIYSGGYPPDTPSCLWLVNGILDKYISRGKLGINATDCICKVAGSSWGRRASKHKIFFFFVPTTNFILTLTYVQGDIGQMHVPVLMPVVAYTFTSLRLLMTGHTPVPLDVTP